MTLLRRVAIVVGLATSAVVATAQLTDDLGKVSGSIQLDA